MTPLHPITTTIIVRVGMLLLACSRQDVVVDPARWSSRADTLLDYSTPHLRFTCTHLDRDSIHAIAGYVEASRDRIVADIQPDSMTTIHIYLYATFKEVPSGDRLAGRSQMGQGSGDREERGSDDLPKSPELEEPVRYDYLLSCIAHEVAHCVTLHANSTIAGRPRWLWESIALYESRQSVDLRSLEYLSGGSLPTLDDLNNINDTRIYEVGYSIIEYVVGKWGIEAVRELIRTNGDLVKTLHIGQKQFQESWHSYVLNKGSQ